MCHGLCVEIMLVPVLNGGILGVHFYIHVVQFMCGQIQGNVVLFMLNYVPLAVLTNRQVWESIVSKVAKTTNHVVL